MDPQKISVIPEWPVPQDNKGVQHFVGVTKFYRKFSRDFSKIISSITQLTKKDIAFSWSTVGQTTLVHLKDLFNLALILRHPEPALHYILEVDASETDIRAILS